MNIKSLQIPNPEFSSEQLELLLKDHKKNPSNTPKDWEELGKKALDVNPLFSVICLKIALEQKDSNQQNPELLYTIANALKKVKRHAESLDYEKKANGLKMLSDSTIVIEETDEKHDGSSGLFDSAFASIETCHNQNDFSKAKEHLEKN